MKSAEDIAALPEYRTLLQRKRAATLPLAALMLVAYYAFVLMVAYAPDALAVKIGDSVISVGIALGLGLIMLTFAVTGFYVWYANTRLSKLVQALQEKAASYD